MIDKELSNPAIVPDNVYNMDETGVLLSVLGSLKVLVSKQDAAVAALKSGGDVQVAVTW
jgi:hypothetical protein